MAKSFGSFPHPVLVDGLGDIESILRVQDATIQFGVETIRIDFDLILDDAYFLDLLEIGSIAIKARLRSGAAFSVQSENPTLRNDFGARKKYSITYAQPSLRGRTMFDVLIVATEKIDDFRPPAMSAVFGDAHFSLLPGDIIGIALQIPIDIEKNYDPLNPPLDSCFRFEKDPTLKSGIKLDVVASEHQITVKMAPDLFERFGLQVGKPEVQIAIVMLPALIGALDLMDESGETYEGLDWHTALLKLAEAHGGSEIENYLKAQRILEDPIGSALAILDDSEWRDE
jgi:hypothetical protein